MTPQEQIKALAELDGWAQNPVTKWWFNAEDTNGGVEDCPNYLTSYDAIIPLVQMQDMRTLNNFSSHLGAAIPSMLHATPAQLSESLLRATERWVE